MPLFTHVAAILLHELAHSVGARLLGIKDQPGNFDWDGAILLTIPRLVHIGVNVARGQRRLFSN